MIAQHGYGNSSRPRIRYEALTACLNALGKLALAENASVHMPRIGCGQAGGRWPVVRELIDEALLDRGVAVFVYDLPGESWTESSGQQTLF
jgi:hypothetical protein